MVTIVRYLSQEMIKKAVVAMKILLLNDNPVVRKLVALSAQKTKDDLDVAWSVDEIEGTRYDLLIVDDAYYSDEIMEKIRSKIVYQMSLLMATRGMDTSDEFDKIINKPFLPTDLVDLFMEARDSIGNMPAASSATKSPKDEEFISDELPLEMSFFDSQEVKELQNLLDDEKEDEFSFDDFDFAEDELVKIEEAVPEENVWNDEFVDVQGEVKEEVQLPLSGDEEDMQLPLSDDEFDMLEQEIQQAVGNLKADDLEGEVGDIDLASFDLNELEYMLADDDTLEGIDELDLIDEREMKLAIGEEVEDEVYENDTSLEIETFEEVEQKAPVCIEKEVKEHLETVDELAHEKGIEALQALLKALSNEEVTKNLKALNISININFGNDK